MKLLFLGSNPSQRSNSLQPFWANTSSRKILNKWIEQISIDNLEEMHFLNVLDTPTPNNRPLKDNEISAALGSLGYKIYGFNGVNPTHIVALGKTAAKALTLLRIPHYAMPHPSGLNRQLNDKNFVEEKIKGLQLYLKSF